MQRHSVILVIMSGLVAAGLVLSAWGTEVLLEDLAKGEGIVRDDSALEVAVFMESRNGIFVVEVLEMSPGIIHAAIIDPDGNTIASEQVDMDVYEGYFDADVSGNYTLAIFSTDAEGRIAAGYIGPEPDASKRTMAFVSMYVLIIGLAGMLATIIYAIVAKRRR